MTARLAAYRRMPIAWLAVFAVIACLALIGPVDHDEDQYFAVAALSARGWPYRDFIDLQGPLFAWWGLGILRMSPGFGLFAARVSQAALAVLTLACFHRVARQMGAGNRPALIATVAMALTETFGFAATVFRNDMLPALLATLALVALTRHRTVSAPAWFAAGLCLAAAAAVKVNYVLLAGAPLFSLALRRDERWHDRVRALLALGAGGLLGALPLLVCFASWPRQVWWQAVTFATRAPLDWYVGTGQGDRVSGFGRLSDFAVALSTGTGLFALASVALAWLRGESRSRDSRLLILDLFVLAGLVAAVLPNPFYRQYLLVALPPLYARFASTRALGRIADAAGKWSVERALLVLFMLAGLAAWLAPVKKVIADPQQSMVASWRESRWVGAAIGQNAGKPAIATLSPHLLIDSGLLPDPRFAAGVFVWRWSTPAIQQEIVSMHGVTPATMAASFLRQPPGAILIRPQMQQADRRDLAAPLLAWALRHGWHRQVGPDGRTLLFTGGPQAAR